MVSINMCSGFIPNCFPKMAIDSASPHGVYTAFPEYKMVDTIPLLYKNSDHRIRDFKSVSNLPLYNGKPGIMTTSIGFIFDAFR
jgi:hypothetical protein